jgi:hypothetical protein
MTASSAPSAARTPALLPPFSPPAPPKQARSRVRMLERIVLLWSHHLIEGIHCLLCAWGVSNNNFYASNDVRTYSQHICEQSKCVCVSERACVRAGMRAGMRAFVRAGARAGGYACVCACVRTSTGVLLLFIGMVRTSRRFDRKCLRETVTLQPWITTSSKSSAASTDSCSGTK